MSSYPSSTIRVLAHTREDMGAVALPPSRSANQHRSELPEGLVSFALIPPSFGINYWYLPAKHRGTEHQAAASGGRPVSRPVSRPPVSLPSSWQHYAGEDKIINRNLLCLLVDSFVCFLVLLRGFVDRSDGGGGQMWRVSWWWWDLSSNCHCNFVLFCFEIPPEFSFFFSSLDI